jgi:lipoyl(octanoyl) transferase
VIAQVLRPSSGAHGLCDYGEALALMEALVGRGAEAPDLLLSVQHPMTVTLGRRGGADFVAAEVDPASVWQVARGGSVTMHGPGQLVLYPIVRLTRLPEPIGRGPVGDLPALVRALERAMQATCATFGLVTSTRDGFSGLWLDDQRKLGSIGVAVRHGWSFHGLALNVDPDLAALGRVTPCGLQGVRMASLSAELRAAGQPVPLVAEVEVELVQQTLRALYGSS